MAKDIQDASSLKERSLPIKDKFAVTTLYFVFLSLLLIGFSGYVSRDNFSKDLGSSADSLDVILLKRNEISKRNKALDDINKKQASMRQEVRDIEREIRDLESLNRVTETEIASLAIPIARGIGERRYGLAKNAINAFYNAYYSETPSTIWAARISRVLSTSEFADTPDRIEKIKLFDEQAKIFFKEIQRVEVILTKSANDYISRKHERDDLNQAIEDAEQKINVIRKELEELNSGLGVEANAIVESYKTALNGLLYHLIEIPTIILTLVVTIAAGGLGSVILYTRCYWRGEDRRLFLTVGEGVAAAVAIFLFAGAGMLMLTQSSATSNGQIELSPYMVAFLSFISGFMAEEAFNRIRVAGRNLFSESPKSK